MNRLFPVAVVSLLAFSALAGCSSTPAHSKNGRVLTNAQSVQGLAYHAEGPTGEGADDALITIAPINATDSGENKTNTLLPWTKTTGGEDGKRVTMTIKSLASHGTVSCNIKYKKMVILNSSTGDHPTVTCSAVLR